MSLLKLTIWFFIEMNGWNGCKSKESNDLGPLIKFSLPLMKSILASLAKNGLMPLGLTAALLATDAEIQKNIHESGITKLIISN